MPEVEYVEARAPRKRQPEGLRVVKNPFDTEPNHFDEIAASNLRLPWRINRSHKDGE